MLVVKAEDEKKLRDRDPKLLTDLEELVEPTTLGDPESPLRWTCKNVRELTEELPDDKI